MEAITYRELNLDEINLSLFASFNRHQEVKKCWRKENNEWVLKNITFTESWSAADYDDLTKYLQNTVKTGGAVFGAFCADALTGFSSVESKFFGSKSDYLQLSCIHTSFEKRGMGIGKNLFKLACAKAKQMGANKLYISTHSSEESQAFYRAIGCVEAAEYNEVLVSKEPCDCQLEYLL